MNRLQTDLVSAEPSSPLYHAGKGNAAEMFSHQRLPRQSNRGLFSQHSQRTEQPYEELWPRLGVAKTDSGSIAAALRQSALVNE